MMTKRDYTTLPWQKRLRDLEISKEKCNIRNAWLELVENMIATDELIEDMDCSEEEKEESRRLQKEAWETLFSKEMIGSIIIED